MQFDLFKHILDIAPGFIGFAVYKFAEGDEEQEHWDTAIMPYFLFAACSWALTCLCELGIEFFSVSLSSIGFTIISMVVAAMLGLCHSLFLKRWLLNAINYIRGKMGLNHVNYASGMLEIFDDGEDHYISVYRGNDKIMSGWFNRMRVKEGALVLIPSPEWEEKLEKPNNVKRTIAYLDKDTHIIEYNINTKS